MTDPVLLPRLPGGAGDTMKQARKIADYIAGMTDRYAIREHKRIFSLDEL
jgi:dGTPase